MAIQDAIDARRERGWTSPGILPRLLGATARRGQANAAAATEEAAPTTEERLEPQAGAVEDLAAAGGEDIEGLNAAELERVNAAKAESARQSGEQATVMHDIERADVAAQTGLEDVQQQIEDTREGVDAMPGEVKAEFDTQQVKLDAGLEQARTGMAGNRIEALAGAMEGRASAMDAAVSSIHGATRNQIASIDAQVQQGTLSPSQAQMMKSKIRMGGAMQLSAAVGQTALAFTKVQAEVATSFGQQYAAFESNAAQVQGQFGATAGSVFGAAQQAKASLNTQLTGLSAQATAHRDSMFSQNAATRATFQDASSQLGMAMLDHTSREYVLTSPVAINNLNAQRGLYADWMKTDHGQAMIDAMKDNQALAAQAGMLNIGMGLIQMFTGG